MTTQAPNRSWLSRHQWLLLRRVSQLSILFIFLLGPWQGIWIVKGNLSSSLTLDVLPLTDPYVLLQSLVAHQAVAMTALTGAVIVTLLYLLVGGRVYCSWVCPINIATDLSSWTRRQLNIKSASLFTRNTRYWLLLTTFVLAAISGTLAWELINPVSLVHRGIIYGLWTSASILFVIYLFDLFISHDAWCGHLCPVGAFYSLLGKFSILRVSAINRHQCDDCLDCFVVCPESQVIKPALKGANQNIGPVIMAANCTNCGRCIDVCDKNVFQFSTRFSNSTLLNTLVKESPK